MVEQDNLVGHGKGLVLIVGHQQGGDLTAFQQGADLAGELAAPNAVEVGKRLVQQKYFWIGRQGSGQCYALLLATRQLVRVALDFVAQSDQVEHLGDSCAALVGTALRQSKADVVADAQMGK